MKKLNQLLKKIKNIKKSMKLEKKKELEIKK